MALYINLINFTDQGIKSVKQSPQRAEAVRKALKDMGGEMKAIYLTMGPYDLVAVTELPNDEVAAQFALTVGAQGNIRTTTMAAFDEAQYKKICEAIG